MTSDTLVFKVSSAVAATVFVSNRLISCRIPISRLAENRLQFVSKYSVAFTVHLSVEHMTTTAFYSQTSYQAKHFKKIVVKRLEHYVAEHHIGWDQYFQMLAYACTIQVHRLLDAPYFAKSRISSHRNQNR